MKDIHQKRDREKSLSFDTKEEDPRKKGEIRRFVYKSRDTL